MNFNKWPRRMKPDNEEELMDIVDDTEVKEEEELGNLNLPL